MQQEQFTTEGLAEYLLNMRASIGSTQQEFARMLDVSKTQLCKYENGQAYPRKPNKFIQKVKNVVCIEIRSRRAAGLPIRKQRDDRFNRHNRRKEA